MERTPSLRVHYPRFQVHMLAWHLVALHFQLGLSKPSVRQFVTSTRFKTTTHELRGTPLPTMRSFSYPVVLLLAICLLITSGNALKQPTSYCKCICFQNSTIIPLNSPPSQSSTPSARSPLLVREQEDNAEDEGKKQQHHHTLTCADCNRAFCLDYNLPICKNAKEEDVFAQCFRMLQVLRDTSSPGILTGMLERDSLKDRSIVTLFILATASLLIWALIKPYIVKSGVSDVLRGYTTVRSGLGSDSTELPRVNARSGGFRNDNAGVGGSGSERAGRGVDGTVGGRGSVSRQGGLNS